MSSILSPGSIALALLNSSSTTTGSTGTSGLSSTSSLSSTGSSFPGGSIAYYNYLAKNGAKLLQQSNNSSQVASAVAYFQSKVALTTPAQATSLVKVNANLPSTDPIGATRTVTAKVYDSKGNPYNITLTFTNDGASQWAVSATKIKSLTLPTAGATPITASVNPGFQVLNFDPVTGAIIPVTTGSNPTSGTSLGVFKLSDGATLTPLFSFSGGGTVGGNLTDTSGAFVSTVKANGNPAVNGPNNITSVNQIFSDPKLLNFILTATGLGDQTQNVGLVKAALLSDPTKKTSVANQLSSSNAKFLSADQTLQLYNGLSNLQDPATIQALITNYQQNTFEQGIAQNDQSVANARYFARNVAQAVQAQSTSTNQAFAILGDSVLRTVVTTALGIPPQLANMPVADQAAAITKRINVSQFTNPNFTAQFVSRYLTQVQTNAFQADLGTASDVALSTLTTINSGGFGSNNSGGGFFA
jgi:hypothetical protein